MIDGVRAALEGKGEIVALDGIRVQFEHGWGLLRASNTEPLLSLCFEATSEADALRLSRSVHGRALRTIRSRSYHLKRGVATHGQRAQLIQRAPRCPPLINPHAKVTHQQLEVQDR
ncbi:MAG: hypothetical protein IPK17_30440 [Chloroflexi bacterium]|nr:hypothetical protein [Chloroflexota bacterium]